MINGGRGFIDLGDHGLGSYAREVADDLGVPITEAQADLTEETTVLMMEIIDMVEQEVEALRG